MHKPLLQLLCITFCLNDFLWWRCNRWGQLLLHFGNVLRMQVIKQTLANQVILGTNQIKCRRSSEGARCGIITRDHIRQFNIHNKSKSALGKSNVLHTDVRLHVSFNITGILHLEMQHLPGYSWESCTLIQKQTINSLDHSQQQTESRQLPVDNRRGKTENWTDQCQEGFRFITSKTNSENHGVRADPRPLMAQNKIVLS